MLTYLLSCFVNMAGPPTSHHIHSNHMFDVSVYGWSYTLDSWQCAL